MALIHANFFSQALGMERAADVILPQRENGIGQSGRKVSRVPVLYLLHGYSDDQTIWQRRTSIERYAVERGLAVVMASTDLGFYCDQQYGYDYWQFFSRELPQIVCELFPMISPKRSETFAAGLSMGGFGALKLGINCPERFSYAASLSGFVDPVYAFQHDRGAHASLSMGTLEDVEGSINDLPARIDQQLEAGITLPKFFIACGTEDALYPMNRQFKERCQKKVDLTWFEEAGIHEWGFWDRNIKRVLDWLPLDKKEAD